MADQVRRLEKVEEAAKEPSDDVAGDPVGGGVIGNESIGMVMDESKLETPNPTISGNSLGAGSVTSVTKTVPISTIAAATVITGVGMIHEQVKLATVGEEREEAKEGEHGSNVQVITFNYDHSQEEIELDLAKFSGHTPHCPNCRHQITKVILRKRTVLKPSVYYRIWEYCIRYVMIVRITESWHTIGQVVTQVIKATHEKARDIKEVISKRKSPVIVPKPAEITEKIDNEDEGGKEKKGSTTIIKTDTINPQTVNLPEETKKEKVKIDGVEGGGDDDEEVDVTGPDTISEQGRTVITIDNSKLQEILKCVVYGGLIESITSLCVVASVAGTDATTLNVLAIGLALLFSGLIAFCLNLVDLKNDAYSIKKYRELLGWTKDNFRLHATCAILSYVIFGLIAPTTYALAFHESDNKERKIIAAVVAAFACIFVLAIAKAYVTGEKKKHPRYVETTRYYLIIAFSVSGVAYAVGYMIERLMLGLGLFRSVQRVTCYVPDQRISATPTGASY